MAFFWGYQKKGLNNAVKELLSSEADIGKAGEVGVCKRRLRLNILGDGAIIYHQ